MFSLQIDSKITLGLGGVFIVLSSVFASIGIYGYFGVETTLIVMEVVPFLILAIGADNIFIYVLDFQVILCSLSFIYILIEREGLEDRTDDAMT